MGNVGLRRVRILTSTALLLLGTVATAQEVTFEIPIRAREKSSETEEKPAFEKLTASQIARMTAEASFWDRFGVDCGNAFQASGLAESTPTNSKPSARLVALAKVDRCIAEFEILLAAQAYDPAKVYIADSLAKLPTDSVAAATKDEQGKANFLGLSFGVGVGISYSEDDVISEAQLGPGNVIIATKDDTTLPRVILESHYYDWCNSEACRAGTRGIGPYFGIVAKSDKLISAFSAGVMFGWKDTTRGDQQGFSIGIGALLDDDVKSLADGLEEGKPLPSGETLRFEEKSRWSAILFFTRTF